MDMTMYGVAIVPLLIGVLEVLKRVGLPERAIPAASVLLGIIIGFAFMETPQEGVIVGLAIGLSAVGLYSGTKNTVGK